MAHKFTIEYDLFIGLFSKDDGRNHYNRRQRASWWVAVYVWKLDEDGELTNEDAWDELTEEEKHIVDTMNVGKI